LQRFRSEKTVYLFALVLVIHITYASNLYIPVDHKNVQNVMPWKRHM